MGEFYIVRNIVFDFRSQNVQNRVSYGLVMYKTGCDMIQRDGLTSFVSHSKMFAYCFHKSVFYNYLTIMLAVFQTSRVGKLHVGRLHFRKEAVGSPFTSNKNFSGSAKLTMDVLSLYKVSA